MLGQIVRSYEQAYASLIKELVQNQIFVRGADQGEWFGCWASLEEFLEFETGETIGKIIKTTGNMGRFHYEVMHYGGPSDKPHEGHDFLRRGSTFIHYIDSGFVITMKSDAFARPL